jgi:hypothetical protein
VLVSSSSSQNLRRLGSGETPRSMESTEEVCNQERSGKRRIVHRRKKGQISEVS